MSSTVLDWTICWYWHRVVASIVPLGHECSIGRRRVVSWTRIAVQAWVLAVRTGERARDAESGSARPARPLSRKGRAADNARGATARYCITPAIRQCWPAVPVLSNLGSDPPRRKHCRFPAQQQSPGRRNRSAGDEARTDHGTPADSSALSTGRRALICSRPCSQPLHEAASPSAPFDRRCSVAVAHRVGGERVEQRERGRSPSTQNRTPVR
jgi:hypothetical protein